MGQGPDTYTVDREHARGGFRYLSLVNNGTGDIELAGLSVYFTAAPTQDLQAYKGYFHSNDELINRIWYAGAYTNRKFYLKQVLLVIFARLQFLLGREFRDLRRRDGMTEGRDEMNLTRRTCLGLKEISYCLLLY